MIMSCSCRSAFQDGRYGTGKRLHTESDKKGPKCTVCGNRKIGVSKPKEKEKSK